MLCLGVLGGRGMVRLYGLGSGGTRKRGLGVGECYQTVRECEGVEGTEGYGQWYMGQGWVVVV